jgi:hypothetical protein
MPKKLIESQPQPSRRVRFNPNRIALACAALVAGGFLVASVVFGYPAAYLVREARLALTGDPRWPAGDSFDVGETAELGCNLFTVKSVTWWSRKRSVFYPGEDGDIRLLVIDLRVFNKDPSERRRIAGGLLFDDRGQVNPNISPRTWDPLSGTLIPTLGALDEATELAPQAGHSGLLFFEVPSSREYCLVVRGGCGSNRMALFRVHTPNRR